MQTPLYGVRNYHVEIVANSEDQVKDTFKVAYDMLHENAKFKGKFSVTKELITNLATGSEMKYNTSNAKTKDGKKGNDNRGQSERCQEACHCTQPVWMAVHQCIHLLRTQ